MSVLFTAGCPHLAQSWCLVNICGGEAGVEESGVSRAQETQERMRTEESGASESPGGLVKLQIAGPSPEVPDSVEGEPQGLCF